jgi:hypothetical protein
MPLPLLRALPVAACHYLLLVCLQGTTCVFSKKVEYLHNLVYQALETIFNKRSQAKQAAAGSGGVGKVGGGTWIGSGQGVLQWLTAGYVCDSHKHHQVISRRKPQQQVAQASTAAVALIFEVRIMCAGV